MIAAAALASSSALSAAAVQSALLSDAVAENFLPSERVTVTVTVQISNSSIVIVYEITSPLLKFLFSHFL